ncbi:MAG: hypothetical protein GDYSWBUE_000270 [Candidatus Fervidibacterota bacterium]
MSRCLRTISAQSLSANDKLKASKAHKAFCEAQSLQVVDLLCQTWQTEVTVSQDFANGGRCNDMGQANVTDEERLWAMLGHLLALLGYVAWIGAYIAPLVIYLVYKDKSQFVAFHALQSLFFQLSLLVVGVVCALLILTIVFACVAIPLLILVSVGALVYIIVAAIKAYNGELFEYWLVGKWARQIVGI